MEENIDTFSFIEINELERYLQDISNLIDDMKNVIFPIEKIKEAILNHIKDKKEVFGIDIKVFDEKLYYLMILTDYLVNNDNYNNILTFKKELK